jgi:hypothetical protein
MNNNTGDLHMSDFEIEQILSALRTHVIRLNTTIYNTIIETHKSKQQYAEISSLAERLNGYFTE